MEEQLELEASIKKRRTDVEVKEQEILRRFKGELEAEHALRAVEISAEDAKAIRGFTFLSQKPILHCVNLDEKAVTLAVIASIRHLDTDYDELLMSGVARPDARERILPAIEEVLASWSR